MTRHRLQKLIAEAGICSRRKAEQLLIQERVKLNDMIAKLGDKAEPGIDKVLIDGKPFSLFNQKRVFLLNKPKGVISSCNDPQGRRTIISLLPSELRKGLYPVGRLDMNSRGLILLTNHGELALRLTHPRYSHTKIYLVWVHGIPTTKTLDEWKSGVVLDGEMTRGAKLKLLRSSSNKSLLEIKLMEGRNRQIRRIAEKLGHPVIDLQRTSIAGIELENLEEGHWRELNLNEWGPIIKTSQNKYPI